MKRYTEKEFNEFKSKDDYIICPTGDYCEIKEFPEKCKFGEWSTFRKNCEFGKNCKFGKNCEFEKNCEFGENCEFGKNCKFGEWCRFGVRCEFGGWCRFEKYCYFGRWGTFGGLCNFGEQCIFEKDCCAISPLWAYVYEPHFETKGKIFPTPDAIPHWEERLGFFFKDDWSFEKNIDTILKPKLKTLLRRKTWSTCERRILKSWL